MISIPDNSDGLTTDFQLFEMYLRFFCRNCSSLIMSDEYLYLDEIFYSMRNRLSFKHYNSSKPAKYALLFKLISTVNYSYTQDLNYCGALCETDCAGPSLGRG